MAADAQMTPMMAQYRRIQSELPKGTLLLFRLGDFYEMFFEDAIRGAQLLNVALTRRASTPMCGIPFHAAEGYIAKLLKAGEKVAICDQVEEAQSGKLVRREVTQILSPGAHFDARMLAEERNNYLAAVVGSNGIFGLAYVDLTTGDFACTELNGEASLIAELTRIRPAEILYPAANERLRQLLHNQGAVVNGYDDWVFAAETAQFTLRDHFKVTTLDGFGLRNRPEAMGAAGGVVHYLAQQLRRNLSHLTRLSCYQTSESLFLDAVTLRNLEVLEPLHRESPKTACLFGALNRTVTPMGARRLRDWLSRPLSALAPIRQRQETIQLWTERPVDLEAFRGCLREVRDLERTVTRLSVGTGNARDLASLRLGLLQIPRIRACLAALLASTTPAHSGIMLGEGSPTAPILLRESLEQLAELPELTDLIGRSIVDEPPLPLKEGGIIREGFDPSLDELRRAGSEGKEWVAQLQQREIERTGIPSLKVRFNSVFGYYIEVTKANLDRVPAEYTRKQTIANGERYITPELKEVESKILGAEERSVKLEYEIFLRIREAVVAHLNQIQQSAVALGQLDVLATFAETARLHNYCRPELRDEGVLRIADGRHPVLEQNQVDERFVPNDVHLDCQEEQIALITGPNMAGKSTYIRQVALLALLAHTGSFVPAASARVDLLDRIFTRIGASDDLSRGQSTFMVEMSETANILHHASPRSLIILDEIGRGTSTFDGLSLAWSIVEHLHNRVGAKTLFATHYHELTELAGRLARVRNYNVAVREWNDQIIFLRKILAGGTDKSYGIQVARLAGVPMEVVNRAKEILRNLEEAELTPDGSVRPVSRHRPERQKLQTLTPPPQLDLFS